MTGHFIYKSIVSNANQTRHTVSMTARDAMTAREFISCLTCQERDSTSRSKWSISQNQSKINKAFLKEPTQSCVIFQHHMDHLYNFENAGKEYSNHYIFSITDIYMSSWKTPKVGWWTQQRRNGKAHPVTIYECKYNKQYISHKLTSCIVGRLSSLWICFAKMLATGPP